MRNSSNTFIVATLGGYAATSVNGNHAQAFEQAAFDHDPRWAERLDDVVLFSSEKEATACLNENFADDLSLDWEVMTVAKWEELTGLSTLTDRLN